MKLEINKISTSKETIVDENLTLDSEVYPPHFPLQEIKNIHASIKAQKFDGFVTINLNIKADVVLICSYTLKPFQTALKNSENYTFTFYEEDQDEDMILIKGNIIDLTQYIYDLVVSSIPMKPVAPNAKLPKEGNGYRVISSDDFEKEKETKGNSKFDKLKDLELD